MNTQNIEKSIYVLLHKRQEFSRDIVSNEYRGNKTASIYMFKVNNRNTRKRCEIC